MAPPATGAAIEAARTAVQNHLAALIRGGARRTNAAELHDYSGALTGRPVAWYAAELLRLARDPDAPYGTRQDDRYETTFWVVDRRAYLVERAARAQQLAAERPGCCIRVAAGSAGTIGLAGASVITVLAWLLPDQFGPGRVAAWSCYLAVFAAVFGWAALVTHWRGHQPKWWLDRRDRLRKAGLARPAVAVVAAVAALAVLAFIGRRL